MSSLEKEIQELQEKNKELVRAAQNWKMEAGEKDKDILRLTKEVNDLRIQLSILRNKGNACARKLEADLQITSETALSHLIQGSNAVAEMMQHIKSFMIEREKIEISTHQSAFSTPTTEKVQRVPPLMLGGRFIQPVVSLSRTMLPHNILTESRQPNENHNGPVRPLPTRLLQELYIPLTRIDADSIFPDNMENNQNTSFEDMGLEDDNVDVPEEEDHAASSRDSTREVLSSILEESEQNITTNVADPVESPSRLLDSPNVNGPVNQSTHEFTPTLRRRKRLSSPRAELSPVFVPSLRHQKHNRTLKVVLAKMKLDDYDKNGAGVSPLKKQMMEEAKNSTKKKNSSRGSSCLSLDSPGPSQETLHNKPGPSGDKNMSPWNGHPQDECNLSWNGSGSSREKSRSPWDQPGPSRNKHISPCYKTDGNSSRDNDYLEEVPSQEMSSSQGFQENCKEKNSFSKNVTHRTQCQSKSEYSKRENSPFSSSNITMSTDSPANSVGEIMSHSRDSRFNMYSMSLDSQNSDIERAQIFDAPSPNGSTNARVIVQEAPPKTKSEVRCDSRNSKHSDSADTNSGFSEDFQEKRTRRTRKLVFYKEKPLNQKLRR